MNNALPKRHVGHVKSTGSPVVVVAMSNPKHPGFALVTQTDTLPDQFHEYLMDAVESSAGQSSINFYEFMDRRPSPDHNLSLLRSFNARGFIREEPTSNILMTPSPNHSIELDDLLDGINGVKKPSSTKTGVCEINQNADEESEKIALAKNLIGQANMLETDANKKREEAYRIAPSLRPVEEISFMEEPSMILDPNGTVNITIPEDKFLG